MSAPLHTAGPWTDQHPYSTPEWVSCAAGAHHGAFSYASLSIGQGDKLIGEVRARRNDDDGSTSYPEVDSLEEMRANARLFAAAPDLLDVVLTLRDYIADTAQGALSYTDRSLPSGLAEMAAEDLARIDAAIAKAVQP